MRSEFNKIHGRVGVIAAVVLALAALGLYFYSERAVPPERETDVPAARVRRPGPARRDAAGELEQPDRPPARDPAQSGVADSGAAESRAIDDAVGGDRSRISEPEISLDAEQQRLHEDLAARLGPAQAEMVVQERLLERLVSTINSLDGDPVPLRFRPLVHVPGLPLLDEDGAVERLPEDSDPRYRPYRALFDRLDAVELAELFDRYEPALELAWQDLGEHSGQPFRARLIEVLEHLAEFELPQARPQVEQP
ncbi:MAG: DUF3014 domain-containing protein, partial [Wenzhouxiangellaceae bacterium]